MWVAPGEVCEDFEAAEVTGGEEDVAFGDGRSGRLGGGFDDVDKAIDVGREHGAEFDGGADVFADAFEVFASDGNDFGLAFGVFECVGEVANGDAAMARVKVVGETAAEASDHGGGTDAEDAKEKDSEAGDRDEEAVYKFHAVCAMAADLEAGASKTPWS